MSHGDFVRFFKLTDAAVGDPSVPIAAQLDITTRHEQQCILCGRRRKCIDTIRRCTIEGGAHWTDIIGARHLPLFIVSERITSGLKEIDASGFRAHAVELQVSDNSPLRSEPHGDYFYLDVTGRIDIDLNASGLAHVERCPQCFIQCAPGQEPPLCYRPITSTWSGTDLFRIRNYPNQQTFCTMPVVELARSQRWSNARFDPMDILRDHITRWAGIDYLGAQWPPRRWYPPSPSEGKTPQEWAEQLKSTDDMERRAACIAIDDIGYNCPEAVIHFLVRLLDDPDAATRTNAAYSIARISTHRKKYYNETLVSNDVVKRVQSLVSEYLAKTLDKCNEL